MTEDAAVSAALGTLALRKAWTDASIEVVRLTTEQSKCRNTIGRGFIKEHHRLKLAARIVELDTQILAAEAVQQLAWAAYRDGAGLRELGRKAREMTG